MTSRERRTGNISDFKKLRPAVFKGTEKPLEAEQWITDMTNLLEAAKIPTEDKVKVIKIQFSVFTSVFRCFHKLFLFSNLLD